MASRLPLSELLQLAHNVFKHQSIIKFNPTTAHTSENYAVLATIVSTGAAMIGLGIMSYNQLELEREIEVIVQQRFVTYF